MHDKDFYSSKWYKIFSKISGKYVEIQMPDEIIKYLNESSFILPKEVCNNSNIDNTWNDNESIEEDTTPTFPKFSKDLIDALDYLGGEAFIKINNIAPKDSAWLTSTKTLKCTNIEDIYLLLKGSTIIQNILKQDGPNYIILKKWQDLNPATEFRCLVHDNKLIAISQRDNRVFYKYINKNKFKIRQMILNFFNEKIKSKMPFNNYIFDIVDRCDKIILIDFNPFEKTTEAILFKWDEINSLITECENDNLLIENNKFPEFRYLGEDPGYVPNPIQSYCYPQELKELCSLSSDLSLVDLLEKEIENQNKQKN